MINLNSDKCKIDARNTPKVWCLLEGIDLGFTLTRQIACGLFPHHLSGAIGPAVNFAKLAHLNRFLASELSLSEALQD